MKKVSFGKRILSVLMAFAVILSCVLTAYAGSITPFNGDSNTGKGQVRLASNGGTIKYVLGTRTGSTSTSLQISPAIGAKCSLTAVDVSDRVFMYWLDEFSGRVYSYDRTIEFINSSKSSFRAQFARVSDSDHFVSFVNYGGTVMDLNTTYAIGETVSFPTETKVPGFTFTGWSMSAAEISKSTEDLIVYPKYTVNDESYKVTITNTDYVSGAGTYKNFQTVNLKADETNGSGDKFSYWLNQDGEIISYDRNYSFRINYNTKLTAVYGETVTEEPCIRISKVYRDVDDLKITFYAERSVPERYTVVAHGMVMSAVASTTDSQMVITEAQDNMLANVRKTIGTSNENCGTYSLAKANVTQSQVVAARPYMIVMDNNTNSQSVVYGEIVRATTTDA